MRFFALYEAKVFLDNPKTSASYTSFFKLKQSLTINIIGCKYMQYPNLYFVKYKFLFVLGEYKRNFLINVR